MLEAVCRRKFLDLVFFIGFALLACHELDAVAQSEWKLLPILNTLPDDAAYRAFIIAHIPLFAMMMWLVGNSSEVVRRRSRLAVDVFLVVHAAVHAAMSGHALYSFHSPLSVFLIFAGGAVAFVHIGMLFIASRVNSAAP